MKLYNHPLIAPFWNFLSSGSELDLQLGAQSSTGNLWQGYQKQPYFGRWKYITKNVQVIAISLPAWKQCLVRLYLQLFLGGLISYLRYLCFFAYSGYEHIMCCVLVLFFFVYGASFTCLFSFDCPFCIL